ncbi:hypothetical protein NXV14_05770 [Bacteroides fragilis]|nr:hypothetical protein [Bacteroides fragilis]
MKQLSRATREYEFTLKGLREAGKGNTEQAKRPGSPDRTEQENLPAIQRRTRSAEKDTGEPGQGYLSRIGGHAEDVTCPVEIQQARHYGIYRGITTTDPGKPGGGRSSKGDAPPERKAARKLFIPYQDEIRGSRFFRRYRCQCRLLLCEQHLGGQSRMSEGIRLAANADGVRRAFDKLDHPGMLSELRKATKDTVNDPELMQAAVRAKDFRIPLEDLGNTCSLPG